MSGWRYVSAVSVIVVSIGVIVWGLTRGSDSPPPVPEATGSSTTTATYPTTTSTTTAVDDQTTETTSAEQRLEEVREILRNLWFGWFDAIYRKDPDALWNVVATRARYNQGVSLFGSLRFADEPTLEAVTIPNIEILLDRQDCLVVWTVISAAFRGYPTETQLVSVLWPDPRYGWRFASHWKNKVDLWENDCNLLERPSTP